ncbi:alpha/beta hydrolase [Nocardia yamanashiensis]|uniref:alpha/beta fold hydrolase n=1 Tax=Nocardia yamanashiensis TaxID=209247 RepID=UPI001E30CB7B|nr:alpha/beta hydrolase [Nocardia yamanashiensis]UGT41473.1 alpha/beta hydrolase [Nocardia yamanashiensis]
MEKITTPAGIDIAYDRYAGGDAGTVILVGGAFSHRGFAKMVQLAQRLAADYGLTVINYDRRGRGDSGDTPGVYDVENEIDDLAALVDAVGGAAALFGWSSGAGLALRAAASGRIPGLTRVIAFEPPFVVNHDDFVPAADLADTLHPMIAAGRDKEVVKFYMINGMGMPKFFTALMPLTPMWKDLQRTAKATAHDWAIMNPFMRGEALRAADWSGVKVPVLVLSGGKSGKLLRTGAAGITAVLPDAEHVEIAKLSHNPNIDLLTPPAGEFLTAAN